jgi:hypothetical protein
MRRVSDGYDGHEPAPLGLCPIGEERAHDGVETLIGANRRLWHDVVEPADGHRFDDREFGGSISAVDEQATAGRRMDPAHAQENIGAEHLGHPVARKHECDWLSRLLHSVQETHGVCW